MKWLERSEPEVPDELKGKSPQEILQMLTEAKTIKQQLETVMADKNKSDSDLAATKQQLTEVQTQIEELRKAQEPKPPTPTPDEPANPWLDPDKFVRERTQNAEIMAMAGGVMSAKLYFRQGLDQLDNKIFGKFEKEIDQAMQGYQPVARMLPANWQVALDVVKGRHFKEISQMSNEGGEFFSETPSSGRQNEPAPELKLSPEEEEACRVFKWDPKTYLESRKKMAVVRSDKGSVARFTND